MQKKALVTGAAGFIGSHLSEALINQGWRVIGIDCFSGYYDRGLKEKNLITLKSNSDFTLIEEDLLKLPVSHYLKDIDVVFHQAGEPGVRKSWGENFHIYVENNILATQCLLEQVKYRKIEKFVFASSSSVYGNTNVLPMKESQLPNPYSPYGLTKLAAEQLCQLYYENYGVPIIALRYFTVYGPRQRPEMAINSFIQHIINDQPITIYGNGSQRRDFTYIEDIVRVNILAANSRIQGEIVNVGSGKPKKLIEVIQILEKIIGKNAKIIFSTQQKGDVNDTFADIAKMKHFFEYSPLTELETGLRQQVGYILSTSG